MSRESILAEVSAERNRQDGLFGGAAHDDAHSAADWVSIIVRHLGLAVDDGSPAGVCMMNDHCAGADPVRYRRQLVRVAAVAVAALEVFDRKMAQSEQAPALLPQGRPPDWWQGVADDFGEAILVLEHKEPLQLTDRRLYPCIPYAVLKSRASQWEWDHKAAEYEPTKRS